MAKLTLPTHCPWPTTGNIDQFAACYVLRDLIETWEEGKPEWTFQLSKPRALARAWELTHVSPMPPFLARLNEYGQASLEAEAIHLAMVIHRYDLRFGTWDILAGEYNHPKHRAALLREGKAIHDFLVRNKLPIPIHSINPPERPSNAKAK